MSPLVKRLVWIYIAIGIPLLIIWALLSLPGILGLGYIEYYRETQGRVVTTALNAIPTYPGPVSRDESSFNPSDDVGYRSYTVSPGDWQSIVDFYHHALTLAPWELEVERLTMGVPYTSAHYYYCFVFRGPIQNQSSKQRYFLYIHGTKSSSGTDPSDQIVGVWIRTKPDTSVCPEPD